MHYVLQVITHTDRNLTHALFLIDADDSNDDVQCYFQWNALRPLKLCKLLTLAIAFDLKFQHCLIFTQSNGQFPKLLPQQANRWRKLLAQVGNLLFMDEGMGFFFKHCQTLNKEGLTPLNSNDQYLSIYIFIKFSLVCY